jgi:diaminopimelate decarboxylase
MEGIRLRGIHCHLGSQIRDTGVYALAAGALLDFAAEVRARTGWWPQEVNLGGGFAVRYTADEEAPPAPVDYARAVAEVVADKTVRLGLPVPRVLVEPGRAVAAPAGWTLYTVGAVKEIPGVRTYVAVDGGMSDNPRPALYHARFEACLADRAAEAPSKRVTVVGRCCESGDILIHDLALPEPAPGDILAVSCTGAYTYTMSMNYNRLPRPAMVLVAGGRAEVVVERETYDDLIARERIPERLGRPGCDADGLLGR